MADKDLQMDVEPEQKKSSKTMLMVIIAVVVLLAGGGAAFFLLGGDDSAEQELVVETKQQAAIYLPLRPSFVVNFPTSAGKPKFLQTEITLMGRDPALMSSIEAHMPLIKSRLVDVLQSQDFEELRTPDGKEALRLVALEELQALFTEELGEPSVEKVYFTIFLLQ